MTTPAATGAPVWIDLMSPDLEASTSFYGQLFGWEFVDGGQDFGHYHTITLNGRPVGGAMASSGLTVPEGGSLQPSWSVYLLTSDAAATTEKVTSNGGHVVVSPMPVGDLGHMAVFIAPSGAGVGAWQRGTFDGFELTLAPGTPCWFETLSTSYDADSAFYRDVFGWDLHPVSDEGFRYATHGEGDAAAAGICADESNAYWRVYFRVENTDQTIERIKELGGHLLDGPMDSPFGRLATVSDPHGASFQIIQDPKKAES